jgi:hypothetical protein
MVPLAHLSRGLRRDDPRRPKNPSSYGISQFSKEFAPVPTAPHPYYVLDAGCRPTTNQPRPAALRWPLFLRYTARLRGFMGFLRTSAIGILARPGAVSLSPGGSSLLVGRVPVVEVRKRLNSHP